MPTRMRSGRTDVRQTTRFPRPDPLIPMFREFPYWRRAKRIYVEHRLIVTIVLVAIGNAAWLLVSEL